MFRVALTLGLLGGSVLAVGACDDDSDEVDEINPTIVEEGDVPFDPAVPDGVDTDTNEVENQGFDDDDLPGPAGNVSELPVED